MARKWPAFNPRQPGAGVCVLNPSTILLHFHRLCVEGGADRPKSTGRKKADADPATGRWYLVDPWEAQVSLILGEGRSQVFR